MVVEIIPRKAVPVPLWQKILFYCLITLILGTVLSYFILGYSQKKSLERLQNLEEIITEEKTPQKIALEKEILNYQRKINNFTLILDYHPLSSKFFSFIQKTIHPNVRYSQVNLNLKESLAVVSGQAETFSALGQQLQILKRSPFNVLEDVALSRISLGRGGKVEFVLTFSFNPSFFATRY